MASYLGLSKKFLPNLRQYEATTGRQISDKAMQNYLYAALQTEADRRDRERSFGLQERGLAMQDRAYKDQASAATMKGITDIAGLPVQGYLGYKALQKAGIIGGTPTPAAPAVTAGGAQALLPGAVGTTGGVQGSLLGVSTPEAVAGISSGAAETPGLLGTFDAATAGGGFLGTLGSTVLPGAAGAGIGKLVGKPIAKALGMHEKTVSDTLGVLGGAGVGFAMGGPIGGLIGGAIGFISSLF